MKRYRWFLMLLVAALLLPLAACEAPGPVLLTYEEYAALSGEEQQAYAESFASYDEFFAWWKDAKAAYDEKNPSPELGGDGSVDLGGETLTVPMNKISKVQTLFDFSSIDMKEG